MLPLLETSKEAVLLEQLYEKKIVLIYCQITPFSLCKEAII